MTGPDLTAADRELLTATADRYAGRYPLGDLSADALSAITAADGIELATALLYDRLATAAGGLVDPSSPIDRDTLVGVVPGAFWRQFAHTGAGGDVFLKLAADLGVAAERVPVPSFGRLDENAAVLLEWLGRRRSRRVVLVTLSKGGPDVKTAVRLAGGRGTLADDFGHVTAWLSVSGPVQGSPLIGWLDARPLRRVGVRAVLALRGLPFDAAEELRRGPAAPLWAWPPMPPAMRVVHLLGVPLRRHLAHRWATRGYDRVAPLGPNDGGGILLGDATAWPGVVRPFWGVDHYHQPRWNVEPMLRDVLRSVLG